MASWGTKKNMAGSKGLDENDLVMRVMLSHQKHDHHLIQNCDLPPPMKVFSGSDNKTVVPFLRNKDTPNNQDDDHADNKDDEEGKLGLLKALRLSQTRAREAEAKFRTVSKERDLIALGFMEASMQVFAYRQLVRLLELQVLKMQKVCDCDCDCDRDRDCGKGKKMEEIDDLGDANASGSGGGSSGFTWFMAVAFCVGIAGFGFALGCKYTYF